MMQKEKEIRVRRVGLVSFFANVFAAFTGFVFVMLVVRRLSVGELGAWYWISRIVSISLFPGVFLNFWVARFVARDNSNSKTALLLNILISLPVSIVYILLIPELAGAVQADIFPFMLASIFIILYYLNSATSSISSGIAPQNVAYSSMIFEIIKILFGFILVYTLSLTLVGAISSVEIALAVQFIVYIALLRRFLHSSIRVDSAKKWISYSWLSALINVSTVLLSLDTIIVVTTTKLQAPTVLAYFAVSVPVSMLLQGGPLLAGLYPKLLKGGGKTHIENTLSFALLFAIPMLVGILVLAKPFVYLYGSAYLIAVPMAQLLSISVFLDIFSAIASSVLLGTVDVDKGKQNTWGLIRSRLFYLPIIDLAMGLSYLVVLYFVLNSFNSGFPLTAGQIGALWTAILVFIKFLFISFKFWFSRRVAKFRTPLKQIAKYLVAAGIMAIVLWYCLPFIVYGLSIYQFFVYPLGLVGIGAATYFMALLAIDKEFRRLVKVVLFAGISHMFDLREVMFKFATVIHSYRILWLLPHERSVKAVASRIRGRLFVDVGAHIGFYSFILHKNFDDIIAVEPHPDNVKAILKGIRNFRITNIQCVAKALSDAEGSSKLFLTGGQSGAAIGSWDRKDNHMIVETTTLDTLLRNRNEVSLVKVDVEGHEFNVLQGARKSMNKIKSWIIELHRFEAKNELEKLMSSQGYACRWIDCNHLFAWKGRRKTN